jgi:hypothetical protein
MKNLSRRKQILVDSKFDNKLSEAFDVIKYSVDDNVSRVLFIRERQFFEHVYVRFSYTSLCKDQRECVRTLSAARERCLSGRDPVYAGSIKNNFQRMLFERSLIVHRQVSVAYKITDNEHHEWLPFPFISHVSNVQIARALFDVKEHWFSAYRSVIGICSAILSRRLDHSNSC